MARTNEQQDSRSSAKSTASRAGSDRGSDTSTSKKGRGDGGEDAPSRKTPARKLSTEGTKSAASALAERFGGGDDREERSESRRSSSRRSRDEREDDEGEGRGERSSRRRDRSERGEDRDERDDRQESRRSRRDRDDRDERRDRDDRSDRRRRDDEDARRTRSRREESRDDEDDETDDGEDTRSTRRSRDDEDDREDTRTRIGADYSRRTRERDDDADDRRDNERDDRHDDDEDDRDDIDDLIAQFTGDGNRGGDDGSDNRGQNRDNRGNDAQNGGGGNGSESQNANQGQNQNQNQGEQAKPFEFKGELYTEAELKELEDDGQSLTAKAAREANKRFQKEVGGVMGELKRQTQFISHFGTVLIDMMERHALSEEAEVSAFFAEKRKNGRDNVYGRGERGKMTKIESGLYELAQDLVARARKSRRVVSMRDALEAVDRMQFGALDVRRARDEGRRMTGEAVRRRHADLDVVPRGSGGSFRSGNGRNQDGPGFGRFDEGTARAAEKLKEMFEDGPAERRRRGTTLRA